MHLSRLGGNHGTLRRIPCGRFRCVISSRRTYHFTYKPGRLSWGHHLSWPAVLFSLSGHGGTTHKHRHSDKPLYHGLPFLIFWRDTTFSALFSISWHKSLSELSVSCDFLISLGLSHSPFPLIISWDLTHFPSRPPPPVLGIPLTH